MTLSCLAFGCLAQAPRYGRQSSLTKLLLICSIQCKQAVRKNSLFIWARKGRKNLFASLRQYWLHQVHRVRHIATLSVSRAFWLKIFQIFIRTRRSFAKKVNFSPTLCASIYLTILKSNLSGRSPSVSICLDISEVEKFSPAEIALHSI